jgi:TonB-dependent receptor
VGFVKRVDGFLATISQPELHDGQTYQVKRPENSAGGDIRGFEVGYQQFFDFLPRPLRGLGLQANYTYVDSSTRSAILGRTVTLQNLSKTSYNLIGLYERGAVSARLAYNWRSRFISSVASFVGIGALPVYTEPSGWLDGSLRYQLSPRVTLSLEGVNLLGTLRRATFGSPSTPQSDWVDDTQVSLAATARF